MKADLLQGVRVLDLTRLLPGPLCTQHLADLGAEVIKIEDTQGGDYGRYGLGTGGEADPDYFASVNRGKRSLALDLKQAAGRDIFHQLARGADLVVEGFRPGVMARLGLAYPDLKALNPRLVYCSITGYGQTGPYRERAGHDLNYCAIAGVIDQTGSPGGAPIVPAFQIADLAGGTLTALATIVAGLLKAQRSGEGCCLDVAMADSVMAHSILALGVSRSGPEGLGRGQGALNGGLPCYGVYRTADGRHLAVGALEPKFWERLCRALERPDLIAQHAAMGTEADALHAELLAVFARRTLAEWLERLAGIDCCVEPVLPFAEALQHPQFAQRGLFVRDAGGAVAGFGYPAVIDGRRPCADAAPPSYGGDGHALLSELGYPEERIEALAAAGVVRLAPPAEAAEGSCGSS